MIPVFTLEIALIMGSEVVCLWYNYTIIHGQNPYHNYNRYVILLVDTVLLHVVVDTNLACGNTLSALVGVCEVKICLM